MTFALAFLALLAAQEERALLLEPTLDLRVVSGSEWDTNARRAVSSEVALGGQRPQQVVGDGLVRLVVDADTRLAITDQDVVRLNYVLGAKRFFREQEEDLLVHDLRFDSAHRLAGFLSAGAEARFRASRMRSGARDYTLKNAGGSLNARFSDQWSFGTHGRYERLNFYFEPRFNNGGPVLSADLTWSPQPRLDFTAFGEVNWRRYEGNALVIVQGSDGVERVTYCDETNTIAGCRPKARNDNEIMFGARVLHRGTFVLGGELSARFQRSTSELERIDRYRISAFATFPLPWELKFSVLGGLQFNRGISATFANYRGEDDESQNSIEGQLARKITKEVGVDLRYALYANEFATASSRFLRQTFYLGLSYEIDQSGER